MENDFLEIKYLIVDLDKSGLFTKKNFLPINRKTTELKFLIFPCFSISFSDFLIF